METLELSLDCLTLDQRKSYNSSHSNLSSSPTSPSSFSDIGDYIGMESCIDLRSSEDVDMTSSQSHRGSKRDHHHHINHQQGCCAMKKKKKREFPPPIPLLVRTENLHSHMPWVLKRYYTSDGRLILREEKVKHHEYFRAHRSNGHFTLQLIHLDDNDDDDHDQNDNRYQDEETEVDAYDGEEDSDVGENSELVYDIDDDEKLEKANTNDNEKKVEKEIVSNDRQEIEVTPSSSIAAAPKYEIGASCSNYNATVRLSPSCFLGLPMPAMKPVHS